MSKAHPDVRLYEARPAGASRPSGGSTSATAPGRTATSSSTPPPKSSRRRRWSACTTAVEIQRRPSRRPASTSGSRRPGAAAVRPSCGPSRACCACTRPSLGSTPSCRKSTGSAESRGPASGTSPSPTLYPPSAGGSGASGFSHALGWPSPSRNSLPSHANCCSPRSPSPHDGPWNCTSRAEGVTMGAYASLSTCCEIHPCRDRGPTACRLISRVGGVVRTKTGATASRPRS